MPSSVEHHSRLFALLKAYSCTRIYEVATHTHKLARAVRIYLRAPVETTQDRNDSGLKQIFFQLIERSVKSILIEQPGFVYFDNGEVKMIFYKFDENDGY